MSKSPYDVLKNTTADVYYTFPSITRYPSDSSNATTPVGVGQPLSNVLIVYALMPCLVFDTRVLSHSDFRDVESLLATHCKARGFPILFLPKFHCELNCIEQCWGYAKRVYRQAPPSSSAADLERNVLDALEAIPLISIRRFYTRAHRFMDAYRRGLSGKQAAWAAKKYHSHRVLPNDILAELDREGITPT